MGRFEVMFQLISNLFEAQVQNLAKKVAWCGWHKKCTTVIKDDASGPPPPKFLCPGQLDSNNMGFANTCSNAVRVDATPKLDFHDQSFLDLQSLRTVFQSLTCACSCC